MQTANRLSIWTELMPFCHFSKESSYLEVTEWTNGEGVDVFIAGVDGNQRVALTYGQFDALKTAMKALHKTSEARFNDRLNGEKA